MFMTSFTVEGVVSPAGVDPVPAKGDTPRFIKYAIRTENSRGKVTLIVRQFADENGDILYNGEPKAGAKVVAELEAGTPSRGGGNYLNGLKAIFTEGPTTALKQEMEVTIA